jgi:hypothetical protein
VPEDLIERVAVAFPAHRVAPEVAPRLADPALSPAARSLLITAMIRFGARAPDQWLRHARWIASVHLKWWDLESAAADLAGGVGVLLDGLVADGFTGTVCSEWGGHEWEPLEVSAAVQSDAHHRLFEARTRSAEDDFRTKTT